MLDGGGERTGGRGGDGDVDVDGVEVGEMPQNEWHLPQDATANVAQWHKADFYNEVINKFVFF